MVNETLLKEVIISQKKIFLNKKNLFRRKILDDVCQLCGKLKEIIVITGLRRSGKSTLLKLIWDEFKTKESLTDDQFLYLNFEDERLINFTKDDFNKILEIYYELYSPGKKKKIFLYFDEIQNIPYWEKWINRLYEENKYKIFVTGSNATLLSSELAVALTGRHIPVTLYPLSFYEFYVYFKNNTLTKQSFYNLEEKAKIKRALDEYLKLGGLPEYLKTKSPELIQEYFKNILLRDIVGRYNIKHKQGLKELAHILLASIGQICSLRNLSKSIEIKNIGTVKNYLRYLEDSFLFFRAPMFSYSYKQQVYNPDKMYLVDMGFFYNAAFKSSENLGHVYENLVFLSLFRDKDNEVFYYKTKNNLEVDFAVKRKNKIKDLIQVCYDLSGLRTMEREETALIKAMEELKMVRGIVINKDIEEAKRIGGKKIIYIPLWKWLLEN
ncbi:MAG: ATP-binding protein [Candidatus Falkowbacteria bacterium]